MDTIELSPDLRDRLAALQTVADRIRLLDRAGYARADIARILGKRYPHVRNVLERDAARAGGAARVPQVSGTDRDVVFRATLGKDGTLALPPEAVAALGLSAGGTLAGRVEDGELHLAEPLAALRKVQAMLRPLRDRLRAEGRSIVDELIADRRAEAAREGDEG